MHAPQVLTGAPANSVFGAGNGGETTLYSAYGLTIESELPLPEFTIPPSGDAGIDARIAFGSGEEWIPQVRDRPSFWHVDSRDARFWFGGVGGFRVRNGCEILVSPEPGIDSALLRLYIEGMMMATLLYQRGFFVLHASVVRIGEDSVAFLGHVGAGKSSTAAALHARGHAVVTDDNAAINLSLARPEVTPAFPCIKVFPAIAASLGYAAGSLKVMHSSQPKCVTGVRGPFPENPVPLSRIYVLTRDAEHAIAPMSRAETVIELIRNSVPTRWKLQGGAAHLQQCALLAARIPTWRIRTFDHLAELPELAERIERHQTGDESV